MLKFEFTQDEVSAMVTQLGARLEHLKDMQVNAAKAGNVKRVLEMEEFMKPVNSGYIKLMKERYK
jgi:hypothetical protein